MSIRRTEPTVSLQEANAVARSATALLDAELSVTVDGTAHTATKAQKASWIDFPVKDSRIVPTVSPEKVKAWVSSLTKEAERDPVNAINDVDSAGTVLQLARPGKSGRRAGNIEPVTAALVQGLGQDRSVSQEISWNEVPHSTENRVVPSGPERFAYQARWAPLGSRWSGAPRPADLLADAPALAESLDQRRRGQLDVAGLPSGLARAGELEHRAG